MVEPNNSISSYNVHNKILILSRDSLKNSNSNSLYLFSKNYHVKKQQINEKRDLDTTAVTYKKLFVNVNRNDSIPGASNLVLQPDDILLEEIVIERNGIIDRLMDRSQPTVFIDQEFLDRFHSTALANSLSRIPGVQSLQLGVGIAKPVIRGMTFNRIIVNNKGIKQEGQQWGADHGLEIDPFDVHEIEIVKGPASLIYGSDGMGGVINLKERRFPLRNGQNVQLRSMYQSNNDAFSQSLFWEGRENEWVWSSRITHQDYADYRVPASEFNYAGFVLPIFENRLKNTAGRELHASASGGYHTQAFRTIFNLSSFNQTAGIFPGAIGIPRAYSLRHEGRHRNIELPRQENTHIMVSNNTQYTFGNSQIELDAGYQYNQRQELSFPGLHGVDPNIDNDLALGLYLQTKTINGRYAWNGNQRQLIFGFQGQWMDNNYDGFEFLLPAFRSTQLGLFHYHVWDISPKTILNAGLRYDRGTHDIQQHKQPLFDRGTLQPTGEFELRNPDVVREFQNLSGATGISFLPSEKTNIKINLGNSFRYPNAIELASNGIHHGNFRHELGDPNLDIERGFQADANFIFSNNKFLIDFSAFYAFYQNYIYLTPTGTFSTLPSGGTLWQYRQDDALFAGTELFIQYELIENLHINISAEWVNNINRNTRFPLPLTPPLNLRNEWAYHRKVDNKFVKKYSLGLDLVYFAPQNRVDRNELTSPEAFLVHFNSGIDFQAFERSLQCIISINNAFNVPYFNHLSRYRLINLPEQGRNIMISIKIPIFSSI